MTYVPVMLWVPDEADASGTTPMIEQVSLKLCDFCFAPIPNHYMNQHVETQHATEAPPGEPANPIAPPPVAPEQH